MQRDRCRLQIRSRARPASLRIAGLLEHSGEGLTRRGIQCRADQAKKLPRTGEVSDRAGPLPSRRPPQQHAHPTPNPHTRRSTGRGTQRVETAQHRPSDGQRRVIAVLVLQAAQKTLGALRFGRFDTKQPQRLQRRQRVGRVRLLHTPRRCPVEAVATLRCTPTQDVSQRGLLVELWSGHSYRQPRCHKSHDPRRDARSQGPRSLRSVTAHHEDARAGVESTLRGWGSELDTGQKFWSQADGGGDADSRPITARSAP